MKLRTKITAAAVSLLLLFSAAFSLWNLSRMQSSILCVLVKSEWQRLNTDARNFSARLSTLQLSGTWYFPAARCIFQKSFSENAVLYGSGEELYNSSPYTFDLSNAHPLPERLTGNLSMLTPIESSHVFLGKTRDTWLLIVYTNINAKLRLLHYRDITDTYTGLRTSFLQGLSLSLFFSVLLSLLLSFLIRRILSSFYQLRNAANVIAAGNYRARVACKGGDETAEVDRSFNHMAECVEQHANSLAAANEKQRLLLAALSHELKTPLTGIQGYAELLQRVSLSGARQIRALQYIESEAIRLSRLSAKMLQLVGLSQETSIEKKEVFLIPLAGHARTLTAARFKQKKQILSIQISGNPAFIGDEDLLLSMLTNLIDNASKASPDESEITLIGNEYGFWVEDHGCGISPEEIAKVTEPFYMVDKSRSRAAGGAGLGLALCAQIARLHDGELQIESTPGVGSRIGYSLLTSR